MQALLQEEKVRSEKTSSELIALNAEWEAKFLQAQEQAAAVCEERDMLLQATDLLKQEVKKLKSEKKILIKEIKRQQGAMKADDAVADADENVAELPTDELNSTEVPQS